MSTLGLQSRHYVKMFSEWSKMCNHEIPYKTAKYKHQLQPTIVNLMLINIHSLTVSHHRQLALL